jgi:Na+-driven multidrug efflux pump
MIAAIGLGNLIQNIFIETIMWSFNASLENLVSQAAGGGNYRNCGIYLN